MSYDKKFVAQKLLYWKDFMERFHLPTWQELPDLDLYMDQVVALLCRYVNLRPHEPEREPILTPGAVNNYVRLKLIPPPVKKKYSRIHMAHLVVICCLKPSMSLASIQQMFPVTMNEEETREAYEDFLRQYRSAYLHCVDQLTDLAENVLDEENQEEKQVESLVLSTAVAGTMYMMVTEKLLKLNQEEEDPKKDG